MKSNIKNIKIDSWYFNLLSIYLVFSIINWLPYINYNTIRVLKYFIFILIFFYELSKVNLKYPSKFFSPIGLVLIILTMLPGLYLSLGINSLIDVLLPFIILWIFNFKKYYYYLAIRNAALVVGVISLFSIISGLTGFWNIEPNGPWTSTFGTAAFGGYRTGYSNSIFLFIPFLVFWHNLFKKRFMSIELFAIVAIIGSQFIAGGRAGLISSLLVFLFGYNLNWSYKILISVIISITAITEEFLIQMRILNPYGSELDANSISSGRIGLAEDYYNLFLARPWFGYGFGEKEDFGGIEVHITWLKNALYGGVFYTIFLFLIFYYIFIYVRGNYYLIAEEKKLFYGMFFFSFIITFLEPNYLIGSVQGEFVYWLVISLLLKQKTLLVLDSDKLKNYYKVVK